MTIKKNVLKQAKELILQAKTIAVSGHINPDGDSIGSLLSLGLGLIHMGKKVYLLNSSPLPLKYASLPGAKHLIKRLRRNVDLAITVDCGTLELLGENAKAFSKAKAIIDIDHHEFKIPFGAISIIDHRAAAVGELIYLLLKELRAAITRDIALNLLVSIIVETNSFRLPGVRPMTFRLCARLLKTGINFPELAENIYWSKTKTEVVLSGICMARCKFIADDKIVWSIITKKDFARIKGNDYDIDAAANDMRAIKGVRIVILFRETRKNFLRVSLRSRGTINIASLAQRYNGGGHYDVAGCFIPNSQKHIKNLLLQAREMLKVILPLKN